MLRLQLNPSKPLRLRTSSLSISLFLTLFLCLYLRSCSPLAAAMGRRESPLSIASSSFPAFRMPVVVHAVFFLWFFPFVDGVEFEFG
jgi:hypothetical protein